MEPKQIFRFAMRVISSFSLALFTAGAFYYYGDVFMGFVLRIVGGGD